MVPSMIASSNLLLPDVPIWESMLRGTLVYLSLVVLFRVALRRQTGTVGLPDILLFVLVSEAVSGTLQGESHSLVNGVIAVATMLFWNYMLDCAAYYSPGLQRLLEPPVVQLVQAGQPIEKNLRHERITKDELNCHFRVEGIPDIQGVESAFIESDGQVSVIPRKGTS